MNHTTRHPKTCEHRQPQHSRPEPHYCRPTPNTGTTQDLHKPQPRKSPHNPHPNHHEHRRHHQNPRPPHYDPLHPKHACHNHPNPHQQTNRQHQPRHLPHPSTHTTHEHHTTIKTGRTQIRFNNLPTQTPGGHHTQITPHPKRPSETHTPHPKQKIHPQPVPPHTQPPTPQRPNPTSTTHPHKQHHQTTIPTPYTHAHKRSPHPTDTQPPNTPRPSPLPKDSIHSAPRAHLPAPHRRHPPHATTRSP